MAIFEGLGISGNILGHACYQKYCIDRGDYLLLIIPIFIILLIFIYMDFVKFKTVDEKKAFRKRKKWLRLILLITRTLMALMLILAFAAPFTTEEVMSSGEEVIKLLVDNSASMTIYNAKLLDTIKDKLKGIPIEMQQIASGEQSAIGDGILSKISGKDNLLVVSDGANNFGKSLTDIGMYSKVSDTRLFAIDIKPERNDAYVTLTGPAETISGTLNKFYAVVNYVGSEPAFKLLVYVDDVLEFTVDAGQMKHSGTIYAKEFVKSFGKGYHKITAKLQIKDFFEQNNAFYKTVKAVEKPKILFITQSPSPIETGLGEIYEMTVMNSLPSSIDKYSAIVFDNIPYSTVSSRMEDLTGFLLAGNGVVFIGGQKSFDKGDYKNSELESMLPVTMGTGKIVDPFHHNIVIVFDVSQSFGDFSFKKDGKNTALDLGKGLAVKMIEGFRDDINVGVVAFADIAQIVSPPVLLKDNRQSLENTISTLRTGDGTQISQGLLFAQKALEKVKGTKNVVLISDGKDGGLCKKQYSIGDAPVRIAEKMGKAGIRIYTVGMPSMLANQAPICKELMVPIAAAGNGNYFEPSEFQFLNVFFGKPEAKDQVFSGNSNLAVMDREHFITKGLDIDAKVSGINFVVPKSGARNLIYTGDGNPVLNTWNFGLGRVVTLATDDGREWAGELLSKDNSMLLTRMINYAVGNPEKGKELYIEAKDGYMGEENTINVKSAKSPVSNELTFKKVSENAYTADFMPSKEGFFQFFDALVAINPAREYYNLGTNAELKDMVDLSGGKIFDINSKEMQKEIKTLSMRKVTKRVDLKMYPLAVLILILLIEIIIRKIYEFK